jgi:hypothetical protein
MKLLIMQSSLASCLFLPLRSKYFPQHSVLRHPTYIFFLSVRDQVSHPYRTTGTVIFVYVLISEFLERRREVKKVRVKVQQL